METLNKTQQEILKLSQYNLPEQNLLEIKDIIAEYLAHKTIESANEDWNKSGMTNKDY